MSGSISQVRRPRFQLMANGAPLLGAETVEVESNGYRQADKFHGTIALGVDPGFGPDWWASQGNVQIQVQMGLLYAGAAEGSGPWQDMFTGITDSISIDLYNQLVTIQGRDLSSKLIDTKIQQTFANQTSSQIAQTIAGQQGLSTNIAATSTPVGQYYQLEHDRTALNNFHKQTTEWDLLCYLADQEGYDIWVSGNTLNFQPAATTSTTPAFTIQYNAGPPVSMNVNTLVLERDLTLAKDIKVTVKSWNMRHKTAYTKSVTGIISGTSGSKGSPSEYVFVKPGLTPDQALQFAQSKLAELTKHERKVHVTMPGELSINSHGTVGLTGTNTDFDMTYFVSQMERTISFKGGFTQSVSLKNTSSRQTTVG